MIIFLKVAQLALLSIILAILLPLAVLSMAFTNVYEKVLQYISDEATNLKNEAYPK